MQTWIEFTRERWGANWCLGPTSPSKRARYGRVVKQSEYDAAEREWEIQTYGAPLKSLHAAAPDMLAALRQLRAAAAQYGDEGDNTLDAAKQLADEAIAKAEGH
jgi:hypothetical protein